MPCKTQTAVQGRSEATVRLKLTLCGCRITVTTTLFWAILYMASWACARSHSSPQMKTGGRTRLPLSPKQQAKPLKPSYKTRNSAFSTGGGRILNFILNLKCKPQNITQEKHNIGWGSVSGMLGVTSLKGSKGWRGRLCRQRHHTGYLEHEQQLHLAHAPEHCVYLLVTSFETDTLFNLQGSRRPPAFTTLWKMYPIVSHKCSCTTVNMIYLPGLMKTNQLWCHFRSQDKICLGEFGGGTTTYTIHTFMCNYTHGNCACRSTEECKGGVRAHEAVYEVFSMSFVGYKALKGRV